MISDEVGKKLHDKATRGVTLSSADQKKLKIWYKDQDDAECESLNLSTSVKSETMLQKEIDSILFKIGSANEEICKLSHHNKLLKKEIFKIQEQLPQNATAHTV